MATTSRQLAADFLINVPVAAVVAWTTRRHVPGSRDASASGSTDWPGALAGVAALAAITYAIIVLPGGGVRSPGLAAAAVLTVVSSASCAGLGFAPHTPDLGAVPEGL